MVREFGARIMAKSKSDRRQEFFDRGVAAYHPLTDGEGGGLYYCPICEQGFCQEDLLARRLTLEHVPPESLGGRAICLTCIECQRLGSRQDAAVKQRTLLWDLNEALHGRPGTYKVKGGAILDIGGHRVFADVDVRQGEAKLIPWTRRNDPQIFNKAIALWNEQAAAEKLKFNLTPGIKFDPRLSKVGDLKTAFLGAFAKYGYKYALHPRIAKVREQIREPRAHALPPWWILPEMEGKEWPVLIGVDQPTQALAAYMRTSLVILPWPRAPDDPYEHLGEVTGTDNSVKMEGSPIDWPTGMEMLLDFETRL
jgi:hypothetical protein